MSTTRLFLTCCFLIVAMKGFSQTVLFSGSFDADSYFTKFEGDWQIIEEDSKKYIVLADNFDAKKAPDLKIFFSKLPFGDIDGDNASNEQSVLITKLSKYKGALKVIIPETIDLSEYQSLIVHCEEYSKLWGGSSISN